MARKRKFDIKEFNEIKASMLRFLKEPPEYEDQDHALVTFAVDEPYGVHMFLDFQRLDLECELMPEVKGSLSRELRVKNPYWPPK